MKKASMKMCLLGIVVFSALLTSCITDGDKRKPVDPPSPPKADLPTPGKICKTCKGDFEVICPKCNGMKEVTCGNCEGLRGKRINCSNCNHGKVKSFLGKEKDCDKCNGKGIITKYCSKCSGTGRVNCKKCSGTGIIDCPECSPKAQE